jgi:hypothetical protein
MGSAEDKSFSTSVEEGSLDYLRIGVKVWNVGP